MIKNFNCCCIFLGKNLNGKNSKVDLKKWESDYKITKKKIEDLKKNPIKREDDQLVKSLKEKLK